MRTLLSIGLLLLASLGKALPPEASLQAGRRMIPISCEQIGDRIQGKAPEGEGAPFRILDGSETIWQGGTGESFALDSPSRTIYLVGSTAGNLAWQGIRTSPGRQETNGEKPAEKGIPSVCTLNAKDYGLAPGQEDAGPALRRLISLARSSRASDTIISLSPGEYHFYPKGALEMSLYISNHDQQDTHAIAIPLVALERVKLKGNDARFIFHGNILPILVMDSREVACEDFSISYDTPYAIEGQIAQIENDAVTITIPGGYRWSVRKGKLTVDGDGWSFPINHALAFNQDGSMVPTGKRGDIPWMAQAEQTGKQTVRFSPIDARKAGLQTGQILVLRHYKRPHPAMLLYRAQSTALNNIIFHDSQGMALLAQRSEDITINGGGCITSPGRVHTVAADATHFSNCRGEIKIQDALYEGMMDDAINVHATCLAIEEILSPRQIRVRYMHPQAIGFEVFLPGENARFIRHDTLEEEEPPIRLDQVERIDETRLLLTLSHPLPAGIRVGDAVENADWHPSVRFIHNTVRHNRARGALFTTPRPVLVKDCLFDRCSGSAILLAGDANGWYESGGCKQVEILNNTFNDNLTARYQFTEGIISIYPEIPNPQDQKQRYHSNIVIAGNTFRTHRVPLLYALSADGIRFSGNTIIYHDLYPPLHGGKPFIHPYSSPPLLGNNKVITEQ